MTKVLVLDALQRSALSVVRSLGRECEVICADEQRQSLASASKLCSHRGVYSSPSNPIAFINDINTMIDQYDIKVLYPTTEITLYTLLENRHLLRPVILPFPEIDTVRRLSNKGSLVRLCEDIGVRAPRSDHYVNGAELLCSDKQYQFPVVIKPTMSRIKTEKGWLNTAVTYAHSECELKNIVGMQEAFKSFPFMVQEYIDGHGSGVFLLYDHGRCVAHFAHKRLREKPPTGGVSVLSQSVLPDPNQLEAAKKLLDSVRWHGVAMVEFRVDTFGESYVIEVNPRFWGSLQLAIDSGVDFPFLLHQIAVGQSVEPVKTYIVGKKLRWLLGDFDRLYLVLKSREYSLGHKIVEIVRFMVPFSKQMNYEMNRFSDLKPFWVELKLFLRAIVKQT